jgi:signal transduction histidine kinase
MRKTFSKILLFILFPVLVNGQLTDSLREIFSGSVDDSVRYEAALRLYDYYEELNRDSAFYYGDQSVLISRKNNRKLNEAYSLSRKAYQEVNLGNYAGALNSLLLAFSICEKKDNDKYYWSIDPLRAESQKRLYALSCTHHIFGILMRETKNMEQQLIHFREAKRIAVEINTPARSLLGSLNLGRIYMELGKPDSALIHENEAETIARSSKRNKYLSGILFYKGMISKNKGDLPRALNYFYESIRSGAEQNNLDGLARAYREIARHHLANKHIDSSFYYANKTIETLRHLGVVGVFDLGIGAAYENFYNAWLLRGEKDSANKYLALAYRANDSINQTRIKNLAEFQKVTLSEQQRLQKAEKEKVAYQNKIRTYFLLAGIGVLLLLAIIFYRNNRQKHKAKLKIERAYDELKATQQQLIQSEKMASLGELTAGIAHEIQNPLNFVNNFSEVNDELLKELKTEAEKGNLEEVKTIANDIAFNSEKINHHGKRADSIVKGMLQHSRTTSGHKEPTDINALADEYFRLAYHGMRAKDKSFNSIIKTNLDPTVGKVNVNPQDIGRAILNLINNAFYAVSEKQNAERLTPNAESYEPTVIVSTAKENGKVEIKVKDNGNGIPQKLLDKIFQPFFTTKPTGQGTGLGLSLSYDIVTKGHGGELKVNTKEGEGSEFTIII